MIIYDKKSTLVIYDDSKCRGVEADKRFFTASPYLNNLVTNLKQHLPTIDWETLTLEQRSIIVNNTNTKKKVSTLEESLTLMGLPMTNIFTRFRNIMSQMYNTTQIELITDSINRLVLKKNKIKLQSKALHELKGKKNDAYFDEKYYYLVQMLDGENWEISGFDYVESGTYCELGHEIKKVVYITSDINNYQMQFGLQCIEDVINLNQTQLNEINNMFDTYKRVITDYTYVLESLSQAPELTHNILKLQHEVLELFKSAIELDKSGSQGQYLRINKRREAEFDSKITVQEYEYLLMLLDNQVPLIKEFVDPFLDLSKSQLGLDRLLYSLRGTILVTGTLVSFINRGLYGQYAPLNLSEDKVSDLMGYPMTQKQAKNVKEQLSNSSRLTQDADKEYIKFLKQGKSILTLFRAIILITRMAEQYGEIKDNVLHFESSWGKKGTAPISAILYHTLELKNSMTVSTLSKLMQPFVDKPTDPKYEQRIEQYLEQVLDYFTLMSSTSSRRSLKIYTMENTLSEITQTSKPTNVLPNMNMDFSTVSLSNFITDKLRLSNLDVHIKESYGIDLRLDNNLSVLFNNFSTLLPKVQSKKPFKIGLKTEKDREIYNTLFILAPTKTLTQGVLDLEVAKVVSQAVGDFFKSEIINQNDKLKNLPPEDTDLTKVNELSSDVNQFEQLEKQLDFFNENPSNINKSAYLELKQIFITNRLRITDPEVKLLSKYTRTASLVIKTLALDVFMTLRDNKVLPPLTTSEYKSIKFITEKVYDSLKQYDSILTSKQALYGSEDVLRILSKYSNK